MKVRLQVLHTLPPLPVHPCPYLPGRMAQDRGFAVGRLDPDVWQAMLDTGWRRAGNMIYEPACSNCRECVPIRIPVGVFQPSRGQRRVKQRNRDVAVRITPTLVTDERAALYERYITTRHPGMMTGSLNEFRRFLGETPVDSCEIEYRVDARLIAVGTIDRTPGGWSCVYCYYDPDEMSRSLGTFNVLTSIDLCREMCPAGDASLVYLGYWVRHSGSMAYKTNFRPFEIMRPDMSWVRQTCEPEPGWDAVHSRGPGVVTLRPTSAPTVTPDADL